MSPKIETESSFETAVVVGALVAMWTFRAISLYRMYFNEATRACKKYKGQAKECCIAKFKVRALQIQINELKKGLPECRKSKNPEKCKKLLTSKITNIQKKLKEAERDVLYDCFYDGRFHGHDVLRK